MAKMKKAQRCACRTCFCAMRTKNDSTLCAACTIGDHAAIKRPEPVELSGMECDRCAVPLDVIDGGCEDCDRILCQPCIKAHGPKRCGGSFREVVAR